jgi:NitT/TauT family transport system ATP-binding protein
MSPAPKLSIENVSKNFETASHTVTAIENVSFQIKESEFLCLLGPSGCGKSTLLNLIAGLEFPEKGRILIDGVPVTGPGSDRMVLFQESALFPWLNVLDNVLFGLKLKPGLTKHERRETAVLFLKLVGLEKFMHVNVHQLSGGMKQRVALARALAPNPKILLMDEPFAALDAMTREQLYTDIQKISQEQHKTIVFVTHNVAEAVCLGDRILVMSPNPGRIVSEFNVDLPRPRDIRDLEVARIANEITHVLRHNSQAQKAGA